MITGLHRRTASIDALQGWTCRGYENITRMTMAALPIVDATDGKSICDEHRSKVRVVNLHIRTILPSTLSPNDKYPVMPTKTYMNAAVPLLDQITLLTLPMCQQCHN